MSEIAKKLTRLREQMASAGVEAVRLRGVDWFAWATAGGDSSVLHAEEAGVAEVFVTLKEACLLTNRIEAARLRAGEAHGWELREFPWEDNEERDAYVRARAAWIFSDYPRGAERPLPASFLGLRLELMPEEVARYRTLGADAAAAVSRAILSARPEQTEAELAGVVAQELWAREIHPLLVMAAGEKRALAYRHPITKNERLGHRVMVVICGRRHGLYANLTRHVFFKPLDEAERSGHEGVLAVEAAILQATAGGLTLPECYARLREAYARLGDENQVHLHHQGGSCGYRSREEIASPASSPAPRRTGVRAYAWNPSLPGAKVEDTVLRHEDGRLEVLTVDPAWPTRVVEGLARPEPFVRTTP